MAARVGTVLLLSLCVSLSSPQYVTEDPASQAVQSGANVTLQCSAPGRSIFLWTTLAVPTVKGVDTSLDDRIVVTIEEGESRLKITGFHAMEHSRLYSCFVGVGGGEAVQSCPAMLSHARIHSGLWEHPSHTTAVAGDNVLLKCRSSESNPEAVITWRKDRQTVTTDDSHTFIMPSGNLYIVGVESSDAGLYQCIATNPVTHTSRYSMEAELTVLAAPDATATSPPSITFHSSEVTVTAGNDAYLECFAEGSPKPSVSWTRPDASFFSSFQQPPPLFPLPTGTLFLSAVEPGQGGMYECTAENANGTIRTIVTLRVLEPPKVSVSPAHGAAAVGDTLILTCTVEGNGHVTVVWFKGGSIKDYLVDVPSPNTHSLTLSGAVLGDAGLYQCMAYNHLGCSSAFVNVTVIEDIVTMPTSEEPTIVPLTVQVEPEVLELGGAMGNTLICTVYGHPTPSVSWMRLDGGEVGVAFTQPFNGGWLSLLDVDSATVYICIANNELDLQSAMATVTTTTDLPTVSEATPTSSIENSPTSSIVISPTSSSANVPFSTQPVDIVQSTTASIQATPIPDVPSPIPPAVYPVPESLDVRVGSSANLSCVVIGALPLSVTWETPEGTELGGMSVVSVLGDTRVYRVLLGPVTAEHEGLVTCRVKWRDGAEMTTFVVVTVKAAPPTRKPMFLDVWWQEDGRVSIVWLRLESHREPSPLEGYKLNWGPSGTYVSQSAAVYVSEEKWTYLTRPLDVYTDYTFKLWAYSLGGDGPVSTFDLPPFRNRSTPTLPPPTSISLTSCKAVSATSAAIHWEAIGDQSSVHQYWLVFTCEDADIPGVNVNPSPSVHLVDDLLPACSYAFHIIGLGQDGDTVVTSQECRDRTPDRNIDFQVEHLPDGSINLSWTLEESLISRGAEVAVNWGQGWVETFEGKHLFSSQELVEGETVQLRVTIGNYNRIQSVTIPPRPSPSPTSPQGDDEETTSSDIILLYVTIFGALLVACAVVIVLILGLKYVQMSRRHTDKVVNDRVKSREEFRRRSLSRSSISSTKKPPLTPTQSMTSHTNGVTFV